MSKALVTAAAILMLAAPVMAGNGPGDGTGNGGNGPGDGTGNGPGDCTYTTTDLEAGLLLARGGNGGGNGPGDGTGDGDGQQGAGDGECNV